MQKLNSFVFNKVLKSTILPIIIVEILLIIFILIAGYNRFEIDRDLSIARSTKGFQSLSMEIAKQMEQEFESVNKDANVLKQIIEPVFSTNHIHKNLELKYKYDAGFYYIDNFETASVYTTNIKKITPMDEMYLEILYLVSSPIDAIIKKYDKKVDSAWVNIGPNYSLYYPKINLSEELSPNLDATKQSYYFSADKKHNPEKKTIFIPLFNEPWALNIGQIGAVVSPIYRDEKMVGVVGISLTSENTKKLSDISLPFNAYVLITDKDGKLLFSSNEKESLHDFKISSFTGLYEAGKNEPLKKFVCSPTEDSDFLFHEHNLSNTGLKLILVTKKSEISKDFVIIFNDTRKAGLVLLFIIFILHIILYKKLKLNTRQMTDDITKPVTEVSNASNKLFHEEKFDFEKSNIEEMNILHVNLYKAHEKLINQLYVDALTGLSNQKKLMIDANKSDSLVLIYIDNFKNVYNSYGVDVGDEILLIFVLQLQKQYGDMYKIYRISTDVFAILGENNTKLSDLYEEIKDIKIVKTDGVHVLLNYSLSMSKPSENTELSLLARAEIALDEVSRQDHQNYIEFNEDRHLNEYRENIKWAKKLQIAFDENLLVAYFQPIFNIKENKVLKFESLVRMIDDDKVVSPFFFLGAAARMGKLSDITRIMMRQVFEISKKYPQVEFSINVSFEDFEQANLLPEIKELVKEYAVNTKNIIFELLETGTLGDEKKIIETIKELKELGFKIAIDDFGTGNSNFAHLMLMKVDYIKIDGQFIKNINEDQQSLNITKTIKTFADMTGAKTIAEFVSEEKILDAITGLEIDFAQGYYLSEPKPASEIDNMLKIII